MGVPAGLTIREITELGAATQLLQAWDALWKQCPHATTFSRPQWLLSWVEVFQPERPRILVIENDTALLGIVPFLIYRDGEDRVLGLMGGGISDYLDILVSPLSEEIVMAAIAEWVEEHKHEWDRIYLSDLHERSLLLRQRTDRLMRCDEHDICPVLDIRQVTGIDQLASSKTMHNLRTARARTKRAGGGEVEIADHASLDPMLNDLFRLHTLRWKGDGHSGGVLDTDQLRTFHCKVTPALLDEGVLRLYGLRHQGQIIASLYALFEKTTVFCYLQGYDPTFGFLSPGTQILAAVIEDAIGERRDQIDLLRGRESYKYLWGAKDTPTRRLVNETATEKTRRGTRAA